MQEADIGTFLERRQAYPESATSTWWCTLSKTCSIGAPVRAAAVRPPRYRPICP